MYDDTPVFCVKSLTPTGNAEYRAPDRRPVSTVIRTFLCVGALLMFCLVSLSGTLPQAQAALKMKGAAATLDSATNPQPADDDILLPMPCGATMALRAVGTQADGYLWDMETLFGCDNCDRQDKDYYERRYNVAVSGPFSNTDLPASWRGKLPKPETGNYYYYFIGKYEISNFQWKAVMEGWCPSDSSPLSADDARPKTNISWFDAMNFTKTYTEWLLKNAPDSLPHFAGDAKNVGYLRLPTEAEWEYAARGGQAVPKSSLREREFFPMADGTDYPQYAVFRSEGGGRSAEETQPIGSRKPNPLGVFDTAGNVAEMVMDTFHFSLGGRLHGSSGGFIRKGGSFVSGPNEILPGRREEVAFFLGSTANSANDLGMRVALSGINTPSGNRPSQLDKEWKTVGEGSNLLLDQGKNPLEELDRLIAAAKNPQEKENLSRLRGILKDNNIALERQNAAAAEGLIRSSLFMVETVRNYGVRHKAFVNMIENSMRERETAKGMSASVKAELEQTISDLNTNKAGMARSIDAAIGFYHSKVEEALNYPEPLFTSKLKLMGAELKGEDVLTRNMRKAYEIYSKHVAMLRQGKRAQLTRDFLLKDILPENLREGLVK